MNSMVCITGMHRSGTSLISSWLELCRLNIHNWLCLARNGRTIKGEDFGAELNFLIDGLSDEELSFKLKQRIVEQFVHFLFDRIALKEPADYWIEQTPRNILWGYERLECFEYAFFIYVYRDHRDIIASLLPLWWGSKSVEEGIEYYSKRFKQWSKTKKNILSHGYADRLIEVNIENLIKFKGTVFQRLFDLLNLNPIEFKVEIEKAHIGRWKNVFDKTERLLLCSRLKNEIEKQGYSRD